jgi:hypothetical protein
VRKCRSCVDFCFDFCQGCETVYCGTCLEDALPKPSQCSVCCEFGNELLSCRKCIGEPARVCELCDSSYCEPCSIDIDTAQCSLCCRQMCQDENGWWGCDKLSQCDQCNEMFCSECLPHSQSHTCYICFYTCCGGCECRCNTPARNPLSVEVSKTPKFVSNRSHLTLPNPHPPAVDVGRITLMWDTPPTATVRAAVRAAAAVTAITAAASAAAAAAAANVAHVRVRLRQRQVAAAALQPPLHSLSKQYPGGVLEFQRSFHALRAQGLSCQQAMVQAEASKSVGASADAVLSSAALSTKPLKTL